MRADRLLSILLLLQTQRRQTTRELARRLEVSERTIHRDMVALSGAGVPVMGERGNGGGWSLLEEYQTDLTGLTLNETQALFLSGPTRLLNDLGLRQASEGAFIKLLASIPSLARRDAEFVRQRIYIDPAGWGQSQEQVPLLPTLQQAIWHERKIKFSYRRYNDDVPPILRVASPLGLVAKGTIWYLVALVEEDVRVYRVSRIHQVIMLDEACQRPTGFDLVAFWDRSVVKFKENLPQYRMDILVASENVQQILSRLYYTRCEQVTEPDEQGRVHLSLIFEDEDIALQFALFWGALIDIKEPLPLRERLIAHIQELHAKYGLQTIKMPG